MKLHPEIEHISLGIAIAALVLTLLNKSLLLYLVYHAGLHRKNCSYKPNETHIRQLNEGNLTKGKKRRRKREKRRRGKNRTKNGKTRTKNGRK